MFPLRVTRVVSRESGDRGEGELTKLRHRFGEVGKVDIRGQVGVARLGKGVDDLVFPEALQAPLQSTISLLTAKSGSRLSVSGLTLQLLPNAFASP